MEEERNEEHNNLTVVFRPVDRSRKPSKGDGKGARPTGLGGGGASSASAGLGGPPLACGRKRDAAHVAPTPTDPTKFNDKQAMANAKKMIGKMAPVLEEDEALEGVPKGNSFK